MRNWPILHNSVQRADHQVEEDPRPYKQVKCADKILSSVERFCQKANGKRTLRGELQIHVTSDPLNRAVQ